MKLVIKNGIIVNPARKQHEKGDIVIENGKILSIGGTADTEGAEVYDANGLFVAPGLIDMHVHLREPGQEAKKIFTQARRQQPQAASRAWQQWPTQSLSSIMQQSSGMC